MPNCNSKGTQYTYKELEAALGRAGATREEQLLLAAIAGAESTYGLKPYGDCQLSADGETPVSLGPWQINTQAWSGYDKNSLISNLDYSAKAAMQVYKKQGPGAWTTYKTKAYKSYLGGSGSPLQKAENIPGVNPEGPIGEVKKTVESGLSWTKEFGEVLSFLGSGAGWLRIGKVVVGSSLLLIAVAELAKLGSGSGGSITNTAKKAGEVVALGGATGVAAALADKGPAAPPEETKPPSAFDKASVAEANEKIAEEVAQEKEANSGNV